MKKFMLVSILAIFVVTLISCASNKEKETTTTTTTTTSHQQGTGLPSQTMQSHGGM